MANISYNPQRCCYVFVAAAVLLDAGAWRQQLLPLSVPKIRVISY
jgi:hypothetical protein